MSYGEKTELSYRERLVLTHEASKNKSNNINYDTPAANNNFNFDLNSTMLSDSDVPRSARSP